MGASLVARVVVQETTVGITNGNAEELEVALELHVVAHGVIHRLSRVSLADVDPINRPNVSPPGKKP